MTRRRFTLQLTALAASLLVLPGMSCNKASDMISSLRQILVAVETALSLLNALGGLLPDLVHTVAGYLRAVLEYVEKVAKLLEDETQSATDKARQILSWATGLAVPVIPDQRVATIVKAVSAAVDKFLSFFGTDQQGAAVQARSAAPAKVPNMTLSDKDKEQLRTIPFQAQNDEHAVEDWQKKAMASPHSELRDPRDLQCAQVAMDGALTPAPCSQGGN